MRLTHAAAWIGSIGAACLSAGAALGAEIYPNRPIRIMATAPGGLTDVVARLIALAKTRPGQLNYAAGTLGSTPQELGTALKSEMARMGKVIKAVGIREE